MKTLPLIALLAGMAITTERCGKDHATYQVTYIHNGNQHTDTIQAEYFARALFGSAVTFHSVGSAPITYENVDTIREL
jgi:hypothetical protein